MGDALSLKGRGAFKGKEESGRETKNITISLRA